MAGRGAEATPEAEAEATSAAGPAAERWAAHGLVAAPEPRWTSRVASRVRAHNLLLLALGVGGVLVLAVVGSWQYLDRLDEPWEVFDLVYLVVAVFLVQLDVVPPEVPYPGALQWARVLAPFVVAAVAATALVTFLSACRQLFDRLLIRGWRRPHVLVVGLGSWGGEAVRALVERGHRVAALDLEPSAESVELARDLQVPLVFGDAREGHALAQARAHRASHVLVFCGSDRVGGAVAAAARRWLHGRNPHVAIQVCLTNRDLVEAWREHELRGLRTGTGATDDAPPVEVFSIPELGAARLLLASTPFEGAGGEALADPRLVVISDDDVGTPLLLEACRQWASRSGDRGGFELVLAGAGAAARMERFHRRSPEVDAAGIVLRSEEEDVFGHRVIDGLLEGSRPTRFYVCLADQAAGLALALRIAERAERAAEHDGEAARPVVVQTGRSGGLVELVLGDRTDPRVRCYGLTDEAFDTELLFGGLWDRVARLVHEAYLGRAQEVGRTGRNVVPWEQLDEAVRFQNLDQARDIPRKVAALGGRIEPLFSATPASLEALGAHGATLEALAEMEHDRWCRVMRDAGYRPPGEGDADHPEHECLVPYAELAADEETAKTMQFDRDSVLNVPQYLAALGYQVVAGRAEADEAVAEPGTGGPAGTGAAG